MLATKGVQFTFVEHLLCVRYYSRYWIFRNAQNTKINKELTLSKQQITMKLTTVTWSSLSSINKLLSKYK